MKVTVKSSAVVEDVNTKTGDVYRQQWAYINQEGIEKPFKIGLGKNGSPFAPGEYELSSKSLQVDQYDKLKLGYVVLVPSAVKKAA